MKTEISQYKICFLKGCECSDLVCGYERLTLYDGVVKKKTEKSEARFLEECSEYCGQRIEQMKY